MDAHGDIDATAPVFLPGKDTPRPPNAARMLRLCSLSAFAAVILYFVVAAPGFANWGNVANIVDQSAILAILAFGMAIVIIGGGADVILGGIDLSIAANLGLSAAVYATTVAAGHSDALAVLLTLGTGIAVGLVNAFAIVALRVLPLLATLAVMNICGGLELVLTQNTVVSAASPLLALLSGPGPFGLSALASVLILITAALLLLVHATPLGLRLHAIGGHRQAAKAAGISVGTYVAGSYVASGFSAAVAAILYAARLSGSAPGAGDLLLSVVVGALLGVVFSRRLVPTIGGTILAVLFIGCLGNGFQLLGIDSSWVNGVEGALILFAVAMTSLIRRREV